MVNSRSFSKGSTKFLRSAKKGIAHVIRVRTKDLSLSSDQQRRMQTMLDWYTKRLALYMNTAFSLHVHAKGGISSDQQQSCVVKLHVVHGSENISSDDIHAWDVFLAIDAAFRDLARRLQSVA